MTRVIFLDVDGVLNDNAVFRDKRFGPFPINHESVLHLHEVVRRTKAMIVLSSSWRDMPMLERKLEAEFVFDVHMDLGADALRVRHEDGSTVRLSGEAYQGRGSEIAEWLGRHPEVQSYVIVDDERDMLPGQMPFLVQTDFKDGLNEEAAAKMIAVLSPTSPDVRTHADGGEG